MWRVFSNLKDYMILSYLNVCMLYLVAAESFGAFEQVKTLWRKCLSFFPLKWWMMFTQQSKPQKHQKTALHFEAHRYHFTMQSHSLFFCCCFPYENEIIPRTLKWNLVTNGGQTFLPSDIFPQSPVPKIASSVFTAFLYAQNCVYCSKEPHDDCWPDNFFTCLPLCKGTASASLLLDTKQFPRI